MDVITAMLTRRSEHHLVDPAPSDEEFAYLLKVAATAPDHGLLRPWRWVLIRGDDRSELGACFAEEAPAERRSQAAAKVQRAPLLASLVFTPAQGHKVPEWEQLAATSAMTNSLMLLLHTRGFGSIWRTGAAVRSAHVRQLLGLKGEENLLGWLYIGTPRANPARRRRSLCDVSSRLSQLSLHR
ncbi:nitroreductase family protein [Streptomyces massasporeus]|uniref:nitroreductase family protein n=1 Tax=Streptomyces massasporeus TaxID=67324 RepID=UPI001678E548|nr:nitroreductase [Streptomyces massasporeus]GGV90718.1 nitroreductase [Streptomyces massasporeus]